MRAKLQQVAELADTYSIPALQAVIDPAFSPPGGAGGRMVTFLKDLAPGTSGGINGTNMMENWPWASDMVTVAVDAPLAVGSYTADGIASVMIHEQAHAADELGRRKGIGRSGGWYTEALAVTAEDMAARLSRGAQTGVRPDDPGLNGNVYLQGRLRTQARSPWTRPGHYGEGAVLLRFAQEQMDPGRAYELHQALAADAPNDPKTAEQLIEAWTIEKVAAKIGMTPRELLEQSMLADITDDLLPADVVERFGYPQLEAWDRTPDDSRADRYASIFLSRLEHNETASLDPEIEGGTYAYWLIPGAKDQGLSIDADRVEIGPDHQVRIVRLKYPGETYDR